MAVIGLWWWHSSRAKPGRRVQEPGPGSGVVPGVSPVPPQQSPGRAAAQEPDRPRGQGSAVPVMGSALSQPLQSSGTAPGPQGTGTTLGPGQTSPRGGMLWGPTLWVLGGRTRLTSLAGMVAQALPAPRGQSPSAPGSHSLWQPWWAGVRLPTRPVPAQVHKHSSAPGCPRGRDLEMSPWCSRETSGARHGTGTCQRSRGAANGGCRPPSQPTCLSQAPLGSRQQARDSACLTPREINTAPVAVRKLWFCFP